MLFLTFELLQFSVCILVNRFVSIEIARNLIERYKVTTPLAKAMGMDMKDKFLPQKVSAELETAICHSFEKQGYTIVDPMAVGDSFVTHCKRERSAGRECPAQWSWIGGLVGEYSVHLLKLEHQCFDII